MSPGLSNMLGKELMNFFLKNDSKYFKQVGHMVFVAPWNGKIAIDNMQQAGLTAS
jgi:hypothetical protein